MPSPAHIILVSARPFVEEDVEPLPEPVYALSNFSAASYFATQVGGGEAGATAPWGIAVLARVRRISANSQAMVTRCNPNIDAGYMYRIDGGSGVINFLAGLNGAVAGAPTTTLTGSDIGRIHLFVGQVSSAGIGQWVARQHRGWGATNVALYSPHAGTMDMGAWTLNLPGFPCSDIDLISIIGFRGDPNQTQIRACYDAAREYGDLPYSMPYEYEVEGGVAALEPYSWLRADLVTTSGAKVSAIFDKARSNHALVQSDDAYRMTGPVPHTAIQGAPVLEMTGSKLYESNLPASAWRFLHDGSGAEVFHVAVQWPTAATTWGVVLGTVSQPNGGRAGFAMYRGANTQAYEFVVNGSTVLSSTAGTIPNGAASVRNFRFALAETPDYQSSIAATGAIGASGNVATAPAVGVDPETPLRLGGGSALSYQGYEQWAETLIFDRVLTDHERETVRAYLRTRYGIGATTITHRWSARDAVAVAYGLTRHTRTGLTAFAPGSYLTTPSPGGVGAVETFTATAHVFVDAAPTFSQFIIGRVVEGANAAGWELYAVNPSTLAIYVHEKGKVWRQVLYSIAAHVGRDIIVTVVASATTLQLYVEDALVGTYAFLSGGMLLHAGPMRVGSVAEAATGVPMKSFTLLAAAGKDAVSTQGEIAAMVTASRAAGRLLPIAGAEHHWDFDLDASGGVPAVVQDRIGTHHLTRIGADMEVAARQLALHAPPTLTDTVTGAPVDAMARVGTPSVVEIDTSRDGRRMLGAMGFTDANYLVSEVGKGLRGSSAGFWGGFPLRVDQQTGLGAAYRIPFSCGSYWDVRTASTNSNLQVVAVNASTSGTSAFSASDVGQWIPCLFRYDPTTRALQLFVRGALVPGGAIGGSNYIPGPAHGFTVGKRTDGFSASGLSVTWFIGGDGAMPTDAEVAAWFAAVDGGARMPHIVGKTTFGIDLTEDLLAANETVPAQILDRVGTDHLTRVGIAVTPDGRGVRGFASTDHFASGSSASAGLVGAVTGPFTISLFLQPDAITSAATRFLAGRRPNGQSGWELRVTPTGQLQAWVTTPSGDFGSSMYQLVAADLTAPFLVSVQYTGTAIRLLVRGAQVGSDVATAGTYTAAVGVSALGVRPDAAAASMPGGMVAIYGATTHAAAVSTVQLSQQHASSVAAGRIVAIPTATVRHYDLRADIEDAGGSLPPIARDRMGSGDDLVRIGAPLQVAQRTERVWSYEREPILYGATDLTLARFYASTQLPSQGRGSPLGYHMFFVFRLDSISVTSSPGTHLMSCYDLAAKGGCVIFAQGANTTIRGGHWSSSATFVSTTHATLGAADVGKIHVAMLTMEAGLLRFMLRRVEMLPSVSASAGMNPAPAAQVRFGGPTSSLALTGITALGGGVGMAPVTTLEYYALCDAIAAADGDVRPVPGKTARWWSTTAAKRARGDVLTLVDQSGSGDDMTIVGGDPIEVPIHARAIGW